MWFDTWNWQLPLECRLSLCCPSLGYVVWYLKLAAPSGMSSFSVSSITRMCFTLCSSGNDWSGKKCDKKLCFTYSEFFLFQSKKLKYTLRRIQWIYTMSAIRLNVKYSVPTHNYTFFPYLMILRVMDAYLKVKTSLLKRVSLRVFRIINLIFLICLPGWQPRW